MLSSFFEAVLVMSVAGSIIYILIMILRPLTDRKFSRTWSYYIRLLVVLLMLIPFGIPGGEIYSRVMSAVSPSVQTSMQGYINIFNLHDLSGYTNQALAAGIAEKQPISIIPYLPYIWLGGMIGFAIVKGRALFKFKRKMRQACMPVTDASLKNVLAECKREMGIRRPLEMMTCGEIISPMLIGAIKSRLILPYVEMDERELRLILRHELTHFKRRDLLFKVLALAAGTLHWFNPFAYLLIRDIDRLCEQACDECVVRHMDDAGRMFYGETILNMMSRAAGKETGLYATLCGGKKEIQRRLIVMLNIKNIPKRIIVLSLTVAVILCSAGVATASIASAKAGISGPPPSATVTDAQNPAAADAQQDTKPEPSIQADVSGSDKQAQAPATNSVKGGAAKQETAAADEDAAGKQNQDSAYVYPVNDNGETYGPIADGRPDLIAVTQNGMSGYIRYKDMDYYPGNMPSSPEDKPGWEAYNKRFGNGYQVDIYAADGKTVLGVFTAGGGNSTDKSYVYQVNENGETYGSSAFGTPDLIAVSQNGVDGYIRYEDTDSYPGNSPNSPDDKAGWEAYDKRFGNGYQVPIYAVDGKTVLGEFTIGSGNSNDKSYDSIEDAIADQLNGG